MKVISVDAEKIPQELKQLNQWVAWRAVPKQDGKTDKIPVDPKTGGAGSVSDRGTWSSFQDAYTYYKKNLLRRGGVGFVFTEKDPFAGADLDNCRNPTSGVIRDWAKTYLIRFNTYSEISPSETGVKLFFKGKLPGRGAAKNGIEVYNQGRFFTVTGERIDQVADHKIDASINFRQKELDALYTEITRRQKGSLLLSGNVKGWEGQALKGVGVGGRHRMALKLAGRWVNKGHSDEEIRHFLISWNQTNKPPKPELADQNSKELADIIRYVREKKTPGNDTGIFPSNAMSGLAGGFASLCADYLEAPAHFFYFAFLTCLGNVLADRLTLASEIAPQPRLFVLLLGESADDRKSTAIKKTVEFFKSTLTEFSVCWGVGSAEGLQKRLEKTPRLLLCFDEFKTFVGKSKIESSVLLPCVNTLFESNEYESWTKKTGIHLTGAFLSMLAASTIQTYERTWDASFTDIGFNNRLWLVPGTGAKKYSFPAKIPEDQKKEMADLLSEILRATGDHLEMTITSEGQELFDGWYLNLPRSIHAKRLDTYALRLMSLLALNDYRKQIDGETVRKVTALCDWQFAVRQLHDPIDADTTTAKLEEKIRRSLRQRPLKDYELKKATNAHRAGLWAFDNAKKNLMRSSEIRWDKVGKVWTLNNGH